MSEFEPIRPKDDMAQWATAHALGSLAEVMEKERLARRAAMTQEERDREDAYIAMEREKKRAEERRQGQLIALASAIVAGACFAGWLLERLFF